MRKWGLMIHTATRGWEDKATSDLPSISSTLFARIFRTKVHSKPDSKLPKRRSYEKFVSKTLMKLTPGRKTIENFSLNFWKPVSQLKQPLRTRPRIIKNVCLRWSPCLTLYFLRNQSYKRNLFFYSLKTTILVLKSLTIKYNTSI